jgi:hypothetical protein
MSKVFLKRGLIFNQTEGDFKVLDMLDNGVYKTHFNERTSEIYLEKISEGFNFGFKLYGVDETLVSHVINTYNHQTNKKNIGVLLNGAKGTGKTVTAKIIANKIGLPIIICDNPYPGLSHFLASINHDCVFFFDEFEKNFRAKCDNEDCAGEDLLSIMDGVYNNDSCHIFLLTTNELRVNNNLISRPSRIRYLKCFGSVISKDILNEYIDDNLKYPERKEEIISFINTLEIATIDIVKTIVEEVNIHNCSVNTFSSFFNVKIAKSRYNIQFIDFYNGEGFLDKNEFLSNIKKSPKERRECNFDIRYSEYVLDKPINEYEVGDFINYDWEIKEIDIDNKFLILQNDGGYIKRMVYIEDINVKPNIFEDKQRNLCGYNFL